MSIIRRRRVVVGFFYMTLMITALLLARKNIRIRRWWSKPHLNPNLRNEMTFFNNLRFNDAEEFFKLFRMTPEQFEELLRLLKIRLTKKNFLRPSLSADLKLAFTLA